MTDYLKSLIREVPDFPKPGINFYDITTLLRDGKGLRTALDALAEMFEGEAVDQVVGIESRGFIFAPGLAERLGAGFVPVRKPGKLPAEVVGEDYDLEYGTDRVEMHADAVEKGSKVLIVDDLIATGGTAAATAKLISGQGASVVGFGFLVELEFLAGKDRLVPHRVESLLRY